MLAEMGGPDPAGDMEGHIKMVLQKIIKTVNGQFLTHNEENGQYFLDLEKTEDYDAIIANKSDTLSQDKLDRYYFQALSYALEIKDDPHVTDHQIYTHNVLWYERNVERPGYLLFGTPNERSTAVPPLEFYIYFPQLLDPPHFEDDEQEDEVFFRLAEPDDEFQDALHTYAAAMELWKRASGTPKRVYRNEAETARKKLISWTRENLRTAFTVTHAGVTKTLAEWAKNIDVRDRIGLSSDETASVREIFDVVSGACLEGHFDSIAPEYPSFDVRISRENIDQAAQRALLQIDKTDTQQGAAILDGLELRTDENLRPRNSKYANYILELLEEKGGDQVVNYEEIMTKTDDSMFMEPDRFRLEKEWVAVVFAALVANGDIILALPNQKYDATNLRALVRMNPEDIADFRYVKPPKDWPVAAIRALLDLLGMATGNAQAMASGDSSPIGEMQEKINSAVEKSARLTQTLEDGLNVWDTALLTGDERERYKAQIQALKEFLETMQNYNSLGKLKNFQASVSEVEAHKEGMEALRHVEAVNELQTSLSPLAGYLSKAETILPKENDLASRLREERGEFASSVTNPENRSDPAFRTKKRDKLQDLKAEYISTYVHLHSRDRLGLREDEKKEELTQDRRLQLLNELSEIEILPTIQLDNFKDDLLGLESCTDLTEEDLQSRPLCKYCEYEPPESRTAPAASKLGDLDEELGRLVDEWTSTLSSELKDDEIQENIELLDSDQKEPIEDFLEGDRLEYPLADSFVESVNTVLRGLTAVTVKPEEVYDALRDGGAPAQADKFLDRFESFLEAKIGDRDDDEVRFVLE
jgi:hypothetical protein